MNYSQELYDIRDNLHREIVHIAVSTYNIWDNLLELDIHLEFASFIDGVPSRTKIIGVDSQSGTLVDDKDCTISYEDVPLEILGVIHAKLKNKEFSFKPDMFL